MDVILKANIIYDACSFLAFLFYQLSLLFFFSPQVERGMVVYFQRITINFIVIHDEGKVKLGTYVNGSVESLN